LQQSATPEKPKAKPICEQMLRFSLFAVIAVQGALAFTVGFAPVSSRAAVSSRAPFCDMKKGTKMREKRKSAAKAAPTEMRMPPKPWAEKKKPSPSVTEAPASEIDLKDRLLECVVDAESAEEIAACAEPPTDSPITGLEPIVGEPLKGIKSSCRRGTHGLEECLAESEDAQQTADCYEDYGVAPPVA